MALFALMDGQVGARVLRVKLDNDSSSIINSLFKDQKAYFEAHHSTIIDFIAGYSPRYDECFKIEQFAESALLIDAVTRDTAIPEWDPASVGIEHIKALFVGVDAPENNNVIAIQTFSKNQILDTSKSFLVGLIESKNTFSKAKDVGFNVDDKLVSFLDGDNIYFRSFFKLRSVFEMNSYFQEATDSELVSFANDPLFSISAGFDLRTIADTVVRTKVTIIQKNGVLTNENIPNFKASALKNDFPLQTVVIDGSEKIVIPQTKKEVKALLDFLDEDIFTGEISNQVFKSTNKRPYKRQA